MKYYGSITDPKDLVNKEYSDEGINNIADSFSTSSIYNIGDLVIYNNTLYKCKQPITVAGAWDSSKWEETNVKEQLDNYLPLDGYSANATVGNAEQLVSSQGITEQTPYNFRTSGGSADIGNRKTMQIVGGSLAWNQLIQNGNFTNTNSWSKNGSASYSASGNVLTLTMASGTTANRIYQQITVPTGHRRIIFFDVRSDDVTTFKFELSGAGSLSGSNDSTVSTSWTTKATVYSGNTANPYVTIGSRDNYDSEKTIQIRNVNVIDLTQLFGSAIADYIYSLETANTGDGVSYFRKLFPKPYYPYNAGELLSVNTSAHVMTGFNQWDEETRLGTYSTDTGAYDSSYSDRLCCKNPISCVPNTLYYFKTKSGITAGNVYFYDANMNFISSTTGNGNTGFNTPANCWFMNISLGGAYGTTYNNDICINLSWSGTRNGEYEPYEKHSYPLDSSLTLRGIPKLDGDNKLYYDGDTYEADGTVTRKYGIVDLGTLNWTVYDGYGFRRFETKLSGKANGNSNIVCSEYETTTISTGSSQPDKTVKGNNQGNDVFIRDTAYESTSAADFKTAMSGVYLVYELATPTTETADTFQSPMVVNDWGTEALVDYAEAQGTRDVAIPCGNVSFYQANLRDKLQHLPNLSANGDGTYFVEQTGTQMSLASATTTIMYAAQVPTIKSTADTALDYVLKAFPTDTISNQPIATFSDGADAIPVKDLVIDITPVQSGSGDPAPDNVRPISGWTGANIEQMGKNLIIRRMENRAINNGGKVIVSDSYDLLIAPCKAGVSYTISNDEVGVVYAEFATLPSVGDMAPNGRVVSPDSKSFSASMNGYVAFRTSHGYATPQIEVGAVATPYVAPLTLTIYPVSWNTEAGTVYGGTLDVTTGLLTVTHASIASYNGESINEPWISSMDVYSAGATPTTGAQVVYPLSTPQTYQLTPTEVKTLLGANNIWADTGNVNNLTYRADPTLFINGKVAALTALISES